MSKFMFISALVDLGIHLNNQEIECINRILDPFGNDYYDMSKLVD